MVGLNRVNAQASSCYHFKPSTDATFGYNIIDFNGKMKTITLPVQNPPTPLQPIEIETTNSQDDPCTIWYLYNEPVSPSISYSTSYQLNLNPSYMSSYDFISGPGLGSDTQGYGFDTRTILRNLKVNPIIELQPYGSYSRIAGETNVTEFVSENKSIVVNIDHTWPAEHAFAQSVQLSVPMTNCVNFSGNGPKKVVFMRGSTWLADTGIFLSTVQNIIDRGFKEIEPFKSHVDRFSFQVDLNLIMESRLLTPDGEKHFTTASGNNIKYTSSCGSNADEYIFLFDDSSRYEAWANIINSVVYLNVDDKFIPHVAMHETGHIIGKLKDEYPAGGAESYTDGWTETSSNCSFDPRSSFSYNGYFYGRLDIVGCFHSGYKYSSGTKHAYYRPSNQSMMNSNWIEPRFNVISCGFIMAAMMGRPLDGFSGPLGEPLNDLPRAKAYWPECENMQGVIKDGYQSMVAGPSPQSISLGTVNVFNITATGFSSTNNAVKLTPIAPTSKSAQNSWFSFLSPKETVAQTVSSTTPYYIVDGLSPSGGNTINLNVPSSTPDGTYKVSIGSSNSPWKDTSYTIVVTGHGSGDQYDGICIDGYAFNGTECAPMSGTVTAQDPTQAIATYSCSAGYTLTTSHTCYKNQTSTFSPAVSYVANPIYSCLYGYPYGIAPNMMCNMASPYMIVSPYPAAVTYICPAGINGTISGNACNVAASSVVTPASTIAASVSYSCPSGYTRSGTTCNPPADITAPAVPTNITSSNVTATGATISWYPSTDASGISSYKLYRNGSLRTTQASTVFTDSGLTTNATYSYKISAVDASTNANTSAQSVALAITTLPVIVSDTTPPSVPTGLVSSNITPTSATISWGASTDASGIYSYNIYRNGASVKVTTGTSFSDSNLTALTTYSYVVKATDSSPNKNISASSSPLSVTTSPLVIDPNDITLPTTPGVSGVIKSNLGETSITLTWPAFTDASGIWKYNIYDSLRRTEPPVAVSYTNTYTFTGLKGSTRYSYIIKAVDGSPNHNESTTYKTAVFTTLSSTDTTPPSTPTNVTGTIIDARTIRFTWDPSTDASDVRGYNISLQSPSTSVSKEILGTTTYGVTSLRSNTTYTFSVSAFDNSVKHNVSATSTPITITTAGSTDTTPPSPPSNLVSSNVSPTSITISWSGSYDSSIYNIYREGKKIATTTTTTYTDTNLTGKKSYSYNISAVDDSGNNNTSALSKSLKVVPVILAAIKPVGPITNKTTGHIYYFLPATKYEDAERAAVELGGHLVTIDDEAENNWVATICRAYDSGRYLNNCFIGFNRTDLQQPFAWTSGSASTYTNWNTGEPNEPGTSAVAYISAEGTASTTSSGYMSLPPYYWADEYSTVQSRPSVVELTSAAKAAAPVLQKVSTTNVISATTPIDFSASVSQSSILLSWNNNNIANIYRMEIERATGNSTTFYHIADASSGSTSFTDTRITTNTAYKYRIRVKFKDGTFGDYTPVVSLTSAVAVNDTNEVVGKSLLSSVIDAVRGLWGW